MKTLRNILFIVFVITSCVSVIQAQESSGSNVIEGDRAISEKMAEPVANTLYGHSFASPSSLYTINSITGAATLVGSIGYSNITDVAFRDNVLYGITFNSFVSIDPATGTGTLVGSLGYGDMNALAVSDSGVFYAASTNGTFINIDEETGHGLYIGDFGSGLDSSGDMAFAKDGTLYASITRTGFTTDWLATINLQSGQASPIWNLGYSGVYGLSLLNDELYGVTTTGLVLHIDIVSGTVSEIGSTGINFGGLTTSPGAIPLLELPYDYTGRSFVDESRDTQIGGKINSYFDHQYPTYCLSPNTGGCSSTDYKAVNFHGYDGGSLNQNQPPYNITYNGHDGIDFTLPGSPQVLAAASGEVTELGYDSCKGNYVTVQHTGGYVTKYYHLASFAPGLHIGSDLTRTTIDDPNASIGIMGNTGNCSDGAHIHFTVENSEGVVVDPYGWKPKIDSAWYGMNDPWVQHNLNLSQPKDASSHYLWLHPMENTKVVLSNTTTRMNSPSNDVSITFFSGTYTSPLRAEFSETSNPVLFNGVAVERAFFLMTYIDDIVPIDVLNNDILIEYVVSQQMRSVVSMDSKFVVWNTANSNWQELPTEWNSATGIISTTSSQLGTFALVNPSRIFLPTVLNNLQGSTPPTIVANPGFENGPTNWSWYSTHGWDLITTAFPGSVVPRNGTWAVWLGGGNDEVSYIEQQVTVSNSTPYLAYWHWIASEDICGYDFGSVRVNGTVIDEYDLCSSSNTGGWVHHVVNLSAYVGQTINFQIRSETDASLNSNLFVDDVSFQATATSLLNRVVVPDYSAASTDSR